MNTDEFKKANWSNPAFTAEHLYIFDLDKNGTVSQAEFEKRPNSIFQQTDKNRDCILSDKEMIQMVSENRRTKGGKKGKRGKGHTGKNRNHTPQLNQNII